MNCELCEERSAEVNDDGAALCLPCSRALDVTESEAVMGQFVTGGIGDVSLPGMLIPPIGLAESLGLVDASRRLAAARRAETPEPSPRDAGGGGGVTSGDVLKVVAVGVGVLAAGAIGLKLVRSARA
jgi:hypothetical protein